MSFLQSIRRAFATKENPAYKAIITLGLSGPIWTGANYTALAQEGYVNNSDVYSCVNIVARACAGIPWLVYNKENKSEPVEVEDGPLVDLISRPNPRQGQAQFFEHLVAYLLLAGNSYFCRVGATNKPPVELWPLRPDRMRVDRGTPLDPIAGYYYYAGSKYVEFEPDNLGHTVLHLKMFHPTDDWYGLSPIQAASRNVDMSNAWQSWNTSLGQNMARPSGAFVSPQTLSQQQYDRMKGELKERLQGHLSAGSTMVLEAGMTWEQMSLNPTDADWLNGDERATRKICSAFGVPPELLGIMSKGGMNDSNFQQARRRLYMETVLPLMDFIKGELNTYLSPMFGGGQYLDYDRDDIEAIQEDRDALWTRVTNAIKSTVITPNEGRKLLGFEPRPEGDVLLLPTAVQTLDGMIAGPPADPGRPPKAPRPGTQPAAPLLQ